MNLAQNWWKSKINLQNKRKEVENRSKKVEKYVSL